MTYRFLEGLLQKVSGNFKDDYSKIDLKFLEKFSKKNGLDTIQLLSSKAQWETFKILKTKIQNGLFQKNNCNLPVEEDINRKFQGVE